MSAVSVRFSADPHKRLNMSQPSLRTTPLDTSLLRKVPSPPTFIHIHRPKVQKWNRWLIRDSALLFASANIPHHLNEQERDREEEGVRILLDGTI